jgi:hypothetical protein
MKYNPVGRYGGAILKVSERLLTEKSCSPFFYATAAAKIFFNIVRITAASPSSIRIVSDGTFDHGDWSPDIDRGQADCFQARAPRDQEERFAERAGLVPKIIRRERSARSFFFK